MHANLHIPFPCPFVIKGSSNLPEGQTVVGMFAYWLVSGHWQVQTGVTGIGEEETVTAAMVSVGRGRGVGATEGGAGGRGMACHARPCGEDGR